MNRNQTSQKYVSISSLFKYITAAEVWRPISPYNIPLSPCESIILKLEYIERRPDVIPPKPDLMLSR